MKRHLWITTPGLFGPVHDPDGARRFLPDLPALSQLLSRATAMFEPAEEAELQLVRRFGLDPAGTRSLAAVALAGEAGARDPDNGGGTWLRLDPVHLRADMARVRMFGPWALALERDEADALIEHIAPNLAAEGIELIAPAPERWYARMDETADIDCHLPAEVVGRNADLYLPTGPDARQWIRRLTEIQMLLHDAPVNQAREAAGKLPVNSVWPWGMGPAIRAGVDTRINSVCSDEPLAIGLARLAGVPVHGLPDGERSPQWNSGTTLLADFSIRDPLHHGDAEGWFAAASELEARIFSPLPAQLTRGELDSLTISGGSGTAWRIGRAGLRLRVWRRRRSWQDWLQAGGA